VHTTGGTPGKVTQVAAVQRKAAHHIPGGDRNVDIAAINDKHTGFDSQHKHHNQASRIGVGKHHDEPALDVDPAPVYRNDGSVIGNLHKHSQPTVPVNAGAICSLKIEGEPHPVKCVLAHGQPPGWVPLRCFDKEHAIQTMQTQMSHEINQARHTGKDQHPAHGHKVITNIPISAAQNALFTKPKQVSFTANHAADYFCHDGNRVNLLVNIPTFNHDGGERFGLAIDVVTAVDRGATEIPTEAKFFPTGNQASSPLFHHGSDKQVDHINFVYGYVVNSAGEKRFGWMNAHLLV
jgi:hypothetical protein